jgi:hypothetical protein
VAAAAALAGGPCLDAAARAAAVSLLGVQLGDEELLLVPKFPQREAVVEEDALLQQMVRKGERW